MPADGTVAPQGGFPDEAFEKLARVEEENYWFESRARLIEWAIRTHAPSARAVLDVGAGTGFVLRHLRRTMPDLTLTGCELSAEGLAICRSRVPDARWLQQDARSLALGGSFDVVCLLDVLEHVADDALVLDRLAAVTRPGGIVIVTVPQHRWLWSRADDYGQHVRRYSRGELVTRMRAAGFDVLRATSFVSLLLPMMAVSRWIDRIRTAPYDPWLELEVDDRVSRVCARMLAAERAAIARGFDWPAGGSLLAIGRRR